LPTAYLEAKSAFAYLAFATTGLFGNAPWRYWPLNTDFLANKRAFAHVSTALTSLIR
jgi:hypothetical protein